MERHTRDLIKIAVTQYFPCSLEFFFLDSIHLLLTRLEVRPVILPSYEAEDLQSEPKHSLWHDGTSFSYRSSLNWSLKLVTPIVICCYHDALSNAHVIWH